MSWLGSPGKKERNYDLIKRGSHNSTPSSAALFVGLRALDPLLQYSILAHGLANPLLHAFGLSTLPPTTSLSPLQLPTPRLLLLAMTTAAAAKQIHWRLFLSTDELSPLAALQVALFNTATNALATLALTARAPAAPLPAAALFALGLALEWLSEAQRARFKRDPQNAGKPFTHGLFRLARHVNYGGYVLWRAGLAMAGAGWVAALAFGGVLAWDFATRAVPVLDRYCAGRYGEGWERFRVEVPWKLLPFLY